MGPVEVFGWRDLWPDSWTSEEQASSAAPYDIAQSECPREMWSSSKRDAEEAVDIESLANYAALCIDSRQAMLNEYLRTHQTEGRLEGDISSISKQYSPKSIAGQDMGRWYSRSPSMQWMTRDARKAARGRSYVGLEVDNDLYYSPPPRYESPRLGSICRAC